MKKLFTASIAATVMMVASISAHADGTTTTTGAPTTTTTTGPNQMTTHVDDTSNINVTSISTTGGKGISHSIPMTVQQQSPGLFGGPAPDIETLVQRVDLVIDHFCNGDIPANINRRLHRDDSEKGDSGNTRITFAPRGANFATFADSHVRKAAIKHIEMIGFDSTGRMRVRTGRDSDGKDLELYCLGDIMVKATINDMDQVTNRTVVNDGDLYLQDRGYFDEYTTISIGLLTKAAPGAVYSTGSGWGTSGSAGAMPVSTLLGALFGFSKSVGIAGATARPELHNPVVYNCTDKDNAICTKLREAGARRMMLSALHDVIMTQFVKGETPSAPEVDKRMADIAANQEALAKQVMKDHEAGQALQGRVEKVEKCADCGNAKAKPEVKPAAKPAAKAPVHHAAKPDAKPAPVAPCDPVTAAQTAHDVCQAKISAAKPAASAAPKK